MTLALRNEAQLEAFIAQVSDRTSPNYGHYLTPDQFAATYGPTQAQVQQVVGHLTASGLSVKSVSSNRTIVEATGPVSAVEAAFGVTISDWHDRDHNRDFFGNDSEPTLPAALASYVVGVAGLNNHYPLQRLGPAPKVGGGPAGGYTPNELKKGYDVTPLASAGYTGSGQPLGLMELDGFRQNNITTYDNQYGLGSPKPATVLINGASGSAGPNEIEVELDIEVMHAIAPASPITVWEGPNSDLGANATYNAIVTTNTTKSNSTSWGICEPNTTPAEMTTLDNIFKQAAAQGQSFYAASGDNGAYDCGDSRLTVDSPANDPYITGTGGTNLALNSDSSYKSESAWSDSSRAIGTGGGVSSYFSRPSWQTGPGVANTYSNGKRQVPDVALDADPQTGYSVYITSGGIAGWNVVGGTSAAAPGWAAFTSVYNQYAVGHGKPNLGYANPTLYSIGSNAQPYPAYHDITTGDNVYHSAAANWDYPTGWGTYDAYNLTRDLAVGLPAGQWAATYATGSTPSNWVANQAQTYAVTLSNNGLSTWNAGGTDPVYLDIVFSTTGGGVNSGTHYAWQRFSLPNDVASGGGIELTITVTPPSRAGSMYVEYQMVKAHEFWFDQYADVTSTVTSLWSAAYGISNTPSKWGATQAQTYTVTLTNNGFSTWNAGGTDPVYLDIVFSTTGGGVNSGTHYAWQQFSLPNDVASGGGIELTITVTPSSRAGSMYVEYQMVKAHEFWFDQYADVTSTVTSLWSAAHGISNTPATWGATQAQTYTVTLTNNGFRTWNAGGTNPVHLAVSFSTTGGGVNSGTHYAWQAFSLPGDVASGGSVTLTISVTAPSQTGSMNVEYQMVKAHEFWFDQYADVAATVMPLWSAAYGVINTPTSWGADQAQTYTVTLTNNGSSTWDASGTHPVYLNVLFSTTGGGVNSGTRYAWQQFSLSNDVASGGTLTLTITVAASTLAGSRYVEYQMVKAHEFWFNQYADVAATVS